MNQISSAATGGVTMTAAGVAPLITWAINGFSKPVPDNVPLIIAAALVTLIHLVINRINAKANQVAQSTPKDPS